MTSLPEGPVSEIQIHDLLAPDQRRSDAQMQFGYDQAASPAAAPPQGRQPGKPGPQGGVAPPQEPFVREGLKVGWNEPCPCGSGKKYKHCHGKLP